MEKEFYKNIERQMPSLEEMMNVNLSEETKRQMSDFMAKARYSNAIKFIYESRVVSFGKDKMSFSEIMDRALRIASGVD